MTNLIHKVRSTKSLSSKKSYIILHNIGNSDNDLVGVFPGMLPDGQREFLQAIS